MTEQWHMQYIMMQGGELVTASQELESSLAMAYRGQAAARS